MSRDVREGEVLVAKKLNGWTLEQRVVLLAYESSVLYPAVSDVTPLQYDRY